MTFTESQKVAIVSDSIKLMRTITEIYGQEKGMQLWEQIADTIDPGLKGDIFVAMLLGDYDSVVRVTGIKPGSNKVSLIKAMRVHDKRGFGLKEAKDIADALQDQSLRSFTIELSHGALAAQKGRQELAEAGFIF